MFLLADTELSSFWFPVQASTFGPEVDGLFYFIYWLCLAFFIPIIGLMVWFMWIYRRQPGKKQLPSPSHHTVLEVTWSVVPSILVLFIFGWGFVGYADMRTPPQNGYEIRVLAKKWTWTFQYPGGFIDPELHVPMDQDVIFIMSSDDVLHSLYVPAFRMKMDVVPGRYTKTWAHPTKEGTYDVFCAEYCGKDHSHMRTKVHVYPQEGFDQKIEQLKKAIDEKPPVELGQYVYEKLGGCVQCHSNDGSKRVGPTFKGLFGSQHKLTNGETITVDENYVRESIVDPNAKIVAGYAPQMPAFKGILNDKKIDGVIAYLKTLK